MRIIDTAFRHSSDMTVNERLQIVEIQLGKAIERESRRAIEAASFDEMVSEMMMELRELAMLKTCNTVVRKRIVALVLRAEKDVRKISEGVEYVRRRKSMDD
jgi:hypothetical protein